MAALLVSVGALIWLFNQIMQALGKRKAEQPFIVSMEARFVSQEDHREHVSSVNDRLQGAKISRERMHDKIGALDARVGRVEEQNNSQTATMAQLSVDLREFMKEQREATGKITQHLLHTSHRKGQHD
jgi:hypothetical protein